MAGRPGRRSGIDPADGDAAESTPLVDFDLLRGTGGSSARSCATSRRRRSRRTPSAGTATTRSRSTPCSPMGELGLFGLPFPEEYGGGGADFTTLCLAIEELAPRRLVDGDHARGRRRARRRTVLLLRHRGAEASEWLPDLCAGRTLGGVRADRTRRRQRRRRHAGPAPARERRRVGDRRRRRRSSRTRARRSRRCVTVTARTGAPREITAIVVPTGHAGVHRRARRTGRWGGTRPTPTRSASTTAGCPGEHCSATAGDGFRQFLAILDDGRIAIAALAVGLAQACLEQSVRYAKERKAFGGPIGREPGRRVQVRRHGGRWSRTRGSLTYKAAWLQGQGRPFKQAAAMAKLYATEAAVDRDPRTRRRSSAATASSTRRRSAASTATPRSSRSAKARARSSAWSSVASWVCPSGEPRPRVPPAARSSGSCRRPHDTKSFVFDVPPDLRARVRATRPGSSAPSASPIGDEDARSAATRCRARRTTDDELTPTVKRVAGGRVSNWMLDRVARGRRARPHPAGGRLHAAAERPCRSSPSPAAAASLR